MFFAEHLPPHFHIEYSGHQALMAIETLAVIEGNLPPRALGLVTEWASIHQDELMDRWERARRFEALVRLEPLP
jgi:hypothetical protein